MTINTSILPFNALTTASLYEILALRCSVFIVEQQCPYQDIDNKDEIAQHVLMKQDEKLIAYARILPAHEGSVHFGRVLIAKPHRGRGLGKKLVDTVIQHLKAHHPECVMVITAQLYLQHFYQEFGFMNEKEPFNLDGIPHIWMMKSP